MRPGDIFESEGGFRLCTSIWGDGPIINNCPWYPTFKDAEEAKMTYQKQEKVRNEVFETLFGHYTEDEVAESKQRWDAKMLRKSNSPFQCRIPNYPEVGGMIEFWINDDGTFECEDSRINHDKIRNLVKELLK